MEIQAQNIVPKAIEVCRLLKAAGFQAYLVGGCVRDLFLGGKPKDWDITTNALPEQVMKVFPKTYPTGLQHGTITVSMGDAPEDMFEVTTYRGEGAYSDGRRPDSVFFMDNVEGDLARRDLTINAMAYDPIDNKLVDPFGGIADLENRMIRAVGDPNERFAEDGLRTMRVARFAARFGFDIDPATEQAIANSMETLGKVSRERMRDELVKTLATKKPSIGLHILFRTGALAVLGSVFASPGIENTFEQIDSCPGAIETRIAVLLHHLTVPQLENELRGLKFSNGEIKKISFLIRKLIQYREFESNPTLPVAKKFLASAKNDAPEGAQSLMEFFYFADAIHLQRINELREFTSHNVLSRKEMNVSGDDLMRELGLKPGPQIKKVLDALYEEIVQNPESNNKNHLLELAKKFEKLATSVLEISKMNHTLQTRANKDWWRLSDPEEKDLLEKEFDFGNGIKFKNKDIENLRRMVEVPAGPELHHPEKNQLLHNNMVFDQARRISDDPKVWYAALMHDLGKVHTDPTLWPKQHGHEELGVPHVETVSNELGVPQDWKDVAKLVAEHHLNGHRALELTPKALRKLFLAFNGDKEKFFTFLGAIEADHRGRLGREEEPYAQKDILSRHWENGVPETVAPPNKNKLDMSISGADLVRELGLSPGKEVGELLKKLKQMVEANPALDQPQTLLDAARSMLGQK